VADLRTLAASVRTLRLEGPRAALDRLVDRRRDASWMRAVVSRGRGRAGEVAVLNLLPTRPAVRLGGVQVQLQARLAAESEERPVALLFLAGPAWRLLRPGGPPRGERVTTGPSRAAALSAGELSAAVRAAMARVGARAVHVENLAGLSPDVLLALAGDGVRLVLGIHDFAPFCPRPHLIEAATGSFCGYCTDPVRCAACLASAGPTVPGFQERRRTVSGALLAAAEALVYPSGFARDAYRALFPGLDPVRQGVIPPAVALPVGERLPSRARGPVRRIACLGPVKPHKGGAVLLDAVRLLSGAGGPRLTFRVYGGGDPELLGPLGRLPGVEVRGSYRAGSLPGLLAADRIDLALLLSVWPETHALVLDECAAAGVPVVAFDMGAQGARVRELGLGPSVPPALGARGVADAVATLARAPRGPEVAADVRGSLASPGDAARAHVALYRRLGLL
jgi:glycosyltransferase involved in cell wall biosynthesis